MFIFRWKTVFENYCHVLNFSCWRNPCYSKELCRHSSLESSEKNKVLLRELPQFCVLMFFQSLNILRKKKFPPLIFTCGSYQRPENVCKCTGIQLLTVKNCNFAAGHLYTELKAGLSKASLCFFNGMNHFPPLKILYLSTSRDSCTSGHPDLQNYVLQKPARTLGNELVGGIEDS